MTPLFRQYLFASAVALAVTVAAVPALAQDEPFEPQVGQSGKDVVWVPTPDPLVQTMLDMANVTADDVVMDLGSGDGKTVIAAAERGARSIGVEFNPDMVQLSRERAALAGVDHLASFEEGDLFEADLTRATVITMFLLPDINLKLRPVILDLEPGTRIVSNSFTMGEWEEDIRERVTEGCSSWCTALMWIVPARVDGTWQLDGQALRFDQAFQKITGRLGETLFTEGRLNGREITFEVGPRTYTGTVEGDSITGTVSDGGTFTATRSQS